MPPKTTEEWKEKVRDWWYSIQDLLAEKDVCLHERKRVEIEAIIKDLITTLRKESEEAYGEGFEDGLAAADVIHSDTK